MKSANTKARDLLGKLERLADPANGGTPGEIAAAQRKLHRLRDRLDFSAPAPDETMDIFAGLQFKRNVRRAVHVHTFQPADFDVASAVKWAIEKATGIPCRFRGADLLAETTPGTANKLAKVALHITQSFLTLLDQLSRLVGVTPSDRTLFVRGLYDGMMNDERENGEPLPTRAGGHVKRTKSKTAAAAPPPRLAIHPYTVALSLGKQIRFARPLEEITAELERAAQPALSAGRRVPHSHP
jgi:plasmid stabilization system protein ParE